MRIMRTSLALAVIAAGFGAGLATAGAPSTPVGSYIRTVTKADLARTNGFRHEGPGQTLPPTGRYRLIVGAKTFSAVDTTGFAVGQTYTATKAGAFSVKAYVDPYKGSFCGPDIPQNASYKWARSGNTLVLKPKDDRCAPTATPFSPGAGRRSNTKLDRS